MQGQAPINETAFRYDYSHRTWIQISAKSGDVSAKDSPVVLLGDFSSGEWDYQCFHAKRHQRMVWCPQHKCFEKVHHIERIDSIRSVTGCRRHGMAAFFSFCTPPIDRKLTVPYRWRITQYANGIVEVHTDALRFRLSYTGENEYKNPQAQEYIVSPHRITVGEIFDMKHGKTEFLPCGNDWNDLGIDIPSEVTAVIFEKLRASAPKNYNLLPTGIMDGAEKIRAFVKRPSDFHIEYWRGFFSDDEFEKLFPKEQSENLPVICRELNLTPTENLQNAYAKNPYAPLWEKLLRFWGFRDEETIAAFYELKDFAGMLPSHFSFDKENDALVLNGLKGWRKDDDLGYEFLTDTAAVTAYEAHLRFAMLRFYVTWALSQNMERAFAKRGLYALAVRPWPNDLHEELTLFYWRFRHYCHYAGNGDGGDNPWNEIAADVKTLSVMARHHLLGLNTEWFGRHWQVEHDRLMEEFHALGSPGQNVAERKPKKKISRLSRIVKIYDAMLTNIAPLIPVGKYEYPPSMKRRDFKVLFSFDPSLYLDEKGKVHRTPRYNLEGEFPPLPDDARRTRLLAYRLFMEDCGFITMEIAEKITGKKISRRTFVRDLEFLRNNCACGKLTYQAAKKIYVWESLGDE